MPRSPLSFELHAPDQITLGSPIAFRFSSETRVSGRIRLTSGTESVPFRLQREAGEPSESAAGHRVRGKSGAFQIVEWGTHTVGAELVLRFEGRKVWMTVCEADPSEG